MIGLSGSAKSRSSRSVTGSDIAACIVDNDCLKMLI